MKKITCIACLIGLLSVNPASATPFTISMVADNDFAIFSGTSSSINNLLYQNQVSWPDQINALSTLQFNLAAGDDTFYVLGMGGGGPEENISGEVNGVNMTDASVNVSMSSNLAHLLTGYNNTSVANGSFNASLVDVQAAFAGLTWSAPNLNSTQTVIQQAGFGQGFIFSTSTAHLFSFEAGDVNVPEPSMFALMGIGLAGLLFRSRRQKLAA